jgi:hypothetical protein
VLAGDPDRSRWSSTRPPHSTSPWPLRPRTAVTPHDHVQQHHHATSSAAPSTADLDAARLLLDRLGISPADLMASTGHQQRAPAPTFAEYIPTVAAAVPPGTRRVYGPYWNRILDHWGARRLDEPTPSQIQQLAEQLKAGVAVRRNARGGRRPPHVGRRQPSAQGHQAPTAALDPPRRTRHPPRRDQPGSRQHRQRPGPRRAAPAPAHRDRVPARRRPRPAPVRSGPRSVPHPAAGEGRNRALATGFPHLDGSPATPRRPTRRTPHGQLLR